MTIDEAIEVLKNDLEVNAYAEGCNLEKALKLGIEALKWKKEFQRYASPPLRTLLPGETK